ncbi:MAG TPA: response regulator [Herpetosiphonaceae bacterium]|nr:response regulator [Herpetosiphonaceae bacterium]
MPKHVLIVEDSRTQAIRIQLELQRYGLMVEVAGTGTAGLAAARTHVPDAIVLDVELPDLNGYALCRQVKGDPRTAHIPVVMLTRRDLAADTLEGLQVGADDYIPKDAFAEQNLVESLRHLGIV